MFTEKLVSFKFTKNFIVCFSIIKVSRFILSFPKFSLVLLIATHNESDIEINNVGGAIHNRYLSRLNLHKQSLETPIHANYPPLLKSILLLLIRRFITRGECNESVYSQYEIFIENILLKSAANIFFRNVLKFKLI